MVNPSAGAEATRLEVMVAQLKPPPAVEAPPPAPTSRRLAWLLAGIVVLAGAGIGFKLMSGSGQLAATVVAQPPGSADIGTATAGVPAAVFAPAPPALAASKAAATATAVAAAKKTANEKDKLTKQVQSKTASPLAASAEPSVHAAPEASVSPRQACEERMLIGFQNCMAAQCAKPAFVNHPLCVERRAIEQRRRDADQSR